MKMKNLHSLFSQKRIYRLLIIVAAASLVCVLTPLSSATAPDVTISVVNNSQKEIRHLFLASAGTDNWGDDQISEAITAGTSRNINASWNESTVKLVAEDEDGCFLTTTLDAAGTPSWTITSSTARNCGS
jgi:hypothetical protein